MGAEALRGFLLCCLLGASLTGSSLLPSPSPAGPEIVVERFKRMSRDEVHFWLKVINRSDRPVFLLGINWESGPNLDPVRLDQWQSQEGWKSPYCMDTPPDVIKLNPGEAITQKLWWKLPMSVICKNPITRLEGRFRFRLDYFESEKQARAYLKTLFSPRWREARAPVAVSKPFEMPPPANP